MFLFGRDLIMVIKDQKGTCIYCLENLERVYINPYGEICAFSLTGCKHKLAKYSTEESAKEVFEDFTKAVLGGEQKSFEFPPGLYSFSTETEEDDKTTGYRPYTRYQNNNRRDNRSWDEQKRRQRVGAYR